MSHVQLQVKPRRVRCKEAAQSPPFRFRAAECMRELEAANSGSIILRAPIKALALICRVVGAVIDASFFLVMLTTWCAMHLVLWSYATDMGPAANCFELPCPPWVASRVLLALVALAFVTFIVASILRRLGHRATAGVFILLVTLDVAAIMLLGASLLW